MKRKSGSIKPTGPRQKWDAARMARINKLLDKDKRKASLVKTTERH